MSVNKVGAVVASRGGLAAGEQEEPIWEGGAKPPIRKYGRGGDTPIRLQRAPTRCHAYVMAYSKQWVNFNGTGIVSREVMACFKYNRVIMAKIQLTLYETT